MELSFFPQVCSPSINDRVKGAKPVPIAIYIDDRCPSTVSAAIDAKTAAFAILVGIPSILHIDSTIDISQVCKSIVGSIAVDVVDFFVWPTSGHIKPSKTMSRVTNVIDLNGDVAKKCEGAGIPIGQTSTRNTPTKYAGRWIVPKEFAQSLRCKIRLSHDAPKKPIGQRPASVRSIVRASTF